MRPRYRIDIIGGGILLALLAAITLGRLASLVPEFDWFAHFPAIYFMLAGLTTLVLTMVGRWKVGSLGLLVVLLSGILLFGPFPREHRGQRTDLTVAAVNVLVTNSQLTAVVEDLPEADIIILLETSSRWGPLLASLKDRWPYQWAELRDDPFGMVVLSRLPVDHADWFLLTPQQNPALQLDLTVGDTTVSVVAIHARSPQSPRELAIRDAQFHLLERRIATAPRNLIVAGDFNATPWSPAFRRLCQRTGLRPTDQGDGPLGSAAGTWPTWLPSVFRIPIDQGLIRGDLESVVFETFRIESSDHLGIWFAVEIGS